MPEISKYRQFLELQIIAAAFFHPEAAHEVMSMVGQGNFGQQNIQNLYACIKFCAERGDLSGAQYLKEVSIRYPKQSPADLLREMDANDMGGPIREKCLLLIELDMREKFGDALKQNELLATAQQDFEKATIWKQCYDYITDPRKDIFEAIPQVGKYLSNYAGDELEQWRKLETSIPKMVDRVRGMERSRRLIDTLTSLAASPNIESHRAECIEIVKDLLVLCISRLPIPDDLSTTLSELKRNSWQLPQKSPVSTSF